MSLHIFSINQIESLRVFRDHEKAKLAFVGHKHLRYDSEEWHEAIETAQIAGGGVFYSVNRTDGRGASAKNIRSVRSFFVDMDDCDKEEALLRAISAPLTPSAIVESASGLHLYYYAKPGQPTDEREYKRVEQGLIKFFDGDKSVKDIARVLRLPGTYHLKNPDDPFLVRVVHQLPHRECPYYSADELLEAYPFPEIEYPSVSVTKAPEKWEAFLEDLSAWEPVRGQRNLAIMIAAGIAIRYGVTLETFIETMYSCCGSWSTGRDMRREVERVGKWAFARGVPMHTNAIRNLGINIRDGI